MVVIKIDPRRETSDELNGPLFGRSVVWNSTPPETILASVHVRAHQQAMRLAAGLIAMEVV